MDYNLNSPPEPCKGDIDFSDLIDEATEAAIHFKTDVINVSTEFDDYETDRFQGLRFLPSC